MDRKRAFYVVFGLALVLGLAAWAQAGGLESLLQSIQALLGEGGGQTFLDFAPTGEKALETSAPQELPEIGGGAAAPGATLLSAVKAALSEKGVSTIEQAFLLPPKEVGPVGNEFQEALED